MLRTLSRVGKAVGKQPLGNKTPEWRNGIVLQSTRAMSALSGYSFETLEVTSPKENVYQVQLNRPDKLNAMNKEFWREVPECFKKISTDRDCRVVILSAAGRVFTAGLDLSSMADAIDFNEEMDTARRAMKMAPTIEDYQNTFTSIEKCTKPVLAAIHNACVGGGVDMVTACDMRYCTQDAWFQIKEVDIGLAADVGTLQRLPKIVGNDSLVRELTYTARRLQSDEALRFGLVSRVFKDKEEMMSATLEMAQVIAAKSPVAVQGSKVNLVYSRDHSVADSLKFVAVWNQGMLQTEDVMKAAMASMQKTEVKFSKL